MIDADILIAPSEARSAEAREPGAETAIGVVDAASSTAPSDPGPIGLGAVDTVPGDTSTTFTITAAGGSVSGWINPAGEADWFKIELTAGKLYTFEIVGSGASPTNFVGIELRDAAGNIIREGDFISAGGERLDFVATSSGTYHLSASDVPGGNTGQYTLTSVEETPPTLAVGGSVAGQISPAGDIDWVKVELTAGTIYRFDLARTGGDASFDPFLRLRDANGNGIASDNDGGPGTDARIDFIATASGTYYLSAEDVFGVSTGDYTFGASTLPSPTLAIGGSATGATSDVDDRDWYRVDLTAGTLYTFAAQGSGATPLTDPQLTLYDAAGNQVAFDDDGGAGLNARLGFLAGATGAYYLAAGRAGSGPDTGQYTVSASEGPPPVFDAIDWETQVTPAAGNVVKVYFALNGESFGSGTPVSTGWTAAEKASAMAALETISDVANLTFAETANAAEANFKLHLSPDGTTSTLGFAGPPGATDEGVMWFNSHSNAAWDSSGLAPGGVALLTLIHEFGHGLGLAHPHDIGGSSAVMLGVTSAFGSFGLFGMNQQVFTIMSYNRGWATGPAGVSGSGYFGSQATPGALDIALLQQKYGANTTFRNGDDVYVLPTAAGPGAFYSTIWDTGGVDEIRHTGALDATIDLRAATIDYATGGGGFVSHAAGIFGGLTIAQGVLIENATGGDGNDKITGNGADNVLKGNGGNDNLNGGAGNDTLEGGGGFNRLVGGLGADTMNGGVDTDFFYIDNIGDTVSDSGGSDRAIVTAGDWTLGAGQQIELIQLLDNAGRTIGGNELGNLIYGAAGGDTLNGFGGADNLIGGGGSDAMNGGAGNDLFNIQDSGDTVIEATGEGVDTALVYAAQWTLGAGQEVERIFGNNAAGVDITGSDTANRIVGTAAIDTLAGAGGNDILLGLGGADTLIGGEGDDLIYGGGGNDAIGGSAGNDRLIGDAGNDTMNGGAGNDLFFIQDSGDTLIEASGEGLDSALVYASQWTLGAGQAVERLYGQNAAGVDLTGNETNNVVVGTATVDILNGAGGHDTIYGYGGADTLFGGVGFDYLDGGAGDDTLTGGAEGDRFVFGSAGDFDRVTDFAAGVGLADRVLVSAALLADFAAVQLAANDINGPGGLGVEIVAGGATLRLEGVLKAQLVVDDFIFV